MKIKNTDELTDELNELKLKVAKMNARRNVQLSLIKRDLNRRPLPNGTIFKPSHYYYDEPFHRYSCLYQKNHSLSNLLSDQYYEKPLKKTVAFAANNNFKSSASSSSMSDLLGKLKDFVLEQEKQLTDDLLNKVARSRRMNSNLNSSLRPMSRSEENLTSSTGFLNPTNKKDNFYKRYNTYTKRIMKLLPPKKNYTALDAYKPLTRSWLDSDYDYSFDQPRWTRWYQRYMSSPRYRGLSDYNYYIPKVFPISVPPDVESIMDTYEGVSSRARPSDLKSHYKYDPFESDTYIRSRLPSWKQYYHTHKLKSKPSNESLLQYYNPHYDFFPSAASVDSIDEFHDIETEKMPEDTKQLIDDYRDAIYEDIIRNLRVKQHRSANTFPRRKLPTSKRSFSPLGINYKSLNYTSPGITEKYKSSTVINLIENENYAKKPTGLENAYKPEKADMPKLYNDYKKDISYEVDRYIGDHPTATRNISQFAYERSSNSPNIYDTSNSFKTQNDSKPQELSLEYSRRSTKELIPELEDVIEDLRSNENRLGSSPQKIITSQANGNDRAPSYHRDSVPQFESGTERVSKIVENTSTDQNIVAFSNYPSNQTYQSTYTPLNQHKAVVDNVTAPLQNHTYQSAYAPLLQQKQVSINRVSRTVDPIESPSISALNQTYKPTHASLVQRKASTDRLQRNANNASTYTHQLIDAPNLMYQPSYTQRKTSADRTRNTEHTTADTYQYSNIASNDSEIVDVHSNQLCQPSYPSELSTQNSCESFNLRKQSYQSEHALPITEENKKYGINAIDSSDASQMPRRSSGGLSRKPNLVEQTQKYTLSPGTYQHDDYSLAAPYQTPNYQEMNDPIEAYRNTDVNQTIHEQYEGNYEPSNEYIPSKIPSGYIEENRNDTAYDTYNQQSYYQDQHYRDNVIYDQAAYSAHPGQQTDSGSNQNYNTYENANYSNEDAVHFAPEYYNDYDVYNNSSAVTASANDYYTLPTENVVEESRGEFSTEPLNAEQLPIEHQEQLELVDLIENREATNETALTEDENKKGTRRLSTNSVFDKMNITNSKKSVENEKAKERPISRRASKITLQSSATTRDRKLRTPPVVGELQKRTSKTKLAENKFKRTASTIGKAKILSKRQP